MTLARTWHIRPYEDHFQFGWEAGRIARALVTGYGYADPFSDAAIRHMNVAFWNVNEVEKLYLHKVAVTLRVIRWQPIIFVEIERHHVPKGETLLPVQSDQFPVELDRS